MGLLARVQTTDHSSHVGTDMTRAFCATVTTAAIALAPSASGEQPDVMAIVARTTTALTRMIDEPWHPIPTDPIWEEIQPVIEVEVAQRPTGPVAMLARRATARIDVRVDPIVSSAGDMSSLQIDARPWFTVASDLPYVVEVRGALDSGPWMRLTDVQSGSKSSARIIDIRWPHDIELGFHHLDVVAITSFLRTSGSPEVLGREERRLPGISFALLDVRHHVRSAATARRLGGVWFEKQPPAYDVFVRSAQTALASAIEPGLPTEPLSVWLDRTFERRKDMHDTIAWRTGYCHEDEAEGKIYRGERAEPQFWSDDAPARLKPRDLCAIFARSLLAGPLVVVRIKVGVVREDTGEWALIPPTLYEAFVEKFDRGLPSPTLADLPRLGALAEDDYPTADLSISAGDVAYLPVRPVPGDVVTVQVTVRNIGRLDVPHAHGMLRVIPCCNEPPTKIDHDFDVSLTIGETATIERRVVLPRGSGWVSVCVFSSPLNGVSSVGYKTWADEQNMIDNCVNVPIGNPPPLDW